MPARALKPPPAAVSAVLFDLDGTLIDSAPDLAGTANDMLAARDCAALGYEQLRQHAGSGARGMIGAAFGIAPGHPDYLALRAEFHDRYEQRMLSATAVFDDIWPVLDGLDARGVVWGIVTNKALRFARPMAVALQLAQRAAVLVGGDSTPHTKPHPAPLLEAARRLAIEPTRCVYVGDDERDMTAGRAAGMAGWAAAWGYLGPGADPWRWNADAVLARPAAILQSLELP